MKTEIVDFALRYLKLGFSVIPLKPKGKSPAIPAWKDFQQRLPTEKEIQGWWARNPEANIGIVTGAISGLIVLDVDGDEGCRSMAELTGTKGISSTPHTNTGKGHHYLYRHPGGEWRNFAGKLPGLDFRGDGGYIVAPPSVHPSGKLYEWVINPLDAEPADPPMWLMNLLSEKASVSIAPPVIMVKKPSQRLAGGLEAETILNNCAFFQHCQDDAETLSEPEWYAMISNSARSTGGHTLIHELSRPHPGYKAGETNQKIEHSLQNGEPQTCQFIQDNLGFTGCPAGGCGVKAPIGFISNQLVLAKMTMESVIQELRLGLNNETIYREEVIGALTVLKNRDAAEYGKTKALIKDACGKLINLNDLEKAVKQKHAQQRNLRLVQPEEKQLALEDIWLDLPVKGLRCPDNWYINENGVWQDTKQGPVCACPVPVILTMRLQNIDSNEEKIKLAFYRDRRWHNITASRPTVFNRMTLVSLGAQSLPVSSETAKDLVRYLMDFESANFDTLPVVRLVSHMGWIDSKRFLPGAEDDIQMDVDLGGMSSVANGYRTEGTLEEWVQFIIPMRKFSIARFTLAASFAAPLLSLVNQRVFLVHNWGPSRGGKTASLKAALSVWGEPDTIMASFNATKVGLERLAAFYSDLPLGIDERQVVGDQQGFVESLVYLLGLGKGKTRGSKDGGLQAFLSWRTIALTTGEEPLSTESSTQGIKTRALEIYGAPIEDEKLAQKLHQGIATNFGTAGPVFVQQILAELATDPNTVKDDYQVMLDYLESQKTGHMGSHISAITTVMLADYYASLWIFRIEDQQAYNEAKALGQFVLDQLETAGEADEAMRAMEYFTGWRKMNANNFNDRPTGREWFGLSMAGNTLVLPIVFERAMQEGGFNVKRALRDWADRGWIETETKLSDGKRRYKIRKMIDGESLQFISIRTNLASQSE